jgi:hypothetical protein
MNQLQQFIIRAERFWQSLPSSVKVAVYGLVSLLLTRLTEDIVAGVQFDPQVYYAIAMTYGYNVFLKLLKDSQDGVLEKLQEQSNQELMDR